jgi:hypothetical protein
MQKKGNIMNIDKMIEDFEKAKNLVLSKKNQEPKDDTDILFHWILNTECNPYATFQSDIAVQCERVESLKDLYHNIHHALEDDGELTLVNFLHGREVKPMAIFDAPNNYQTFEEFENKILENHPKHPAIKTGVELFEGDIKDFVKKAEEYHVNSIKRCYLMDGARFGAKEANKHYKDYGCFDPEWEKDIKSINRVKRSKP